MGDEQGIDYAEHLGRGCVACGERALDVVFVVAGTGMPPGHSEHNIGYDHRLLARCTACGGLQLEVYDHDCFDHDAVHDQYEWFTLTGDVEGLLGFVERCPHPLDRECECRRHEVVRERTGHLRRRPWRLGGEHDAHVQQARVRLRWWKPVFGVVG